MTRPMGFDTFMRPRLAAADALLDGNAGPLPARSTLASPASVFGPQGHRAQSAEVMSEANARTTSRCKPVGENHFGVMYSVASLIFANGPGIQRSAMRTHKQTQGVPRAWSANVPSRLAMTAAPCGRTC